MPVRLSRTPLALVASLAATALLSTGCVSTEKYNALRIENDGLNQQLTRATSDARDARTQAAAWKAQLDAQVAAASNTGGLSANLIQQNADLRNQLADITGKYNDAIQRIGSAGTQLPVELTNELTKFADQNPTFVEFDAKTGSVKFKSDLTFASGDAALAPGAAAAIDSFAQILNGEAAKGYELLVCGHADNQKVTSRTQSMGHKDNWYLSSHRALSVAEALQQKGVAPSRIGAVGYGEYRPIADNGSKAGMAQNRRVEVLIMPTQIAGGTPPVASAADVAAPVQPKAVVTSMQKRADEDTSK